MDEDALKEVMEFFYEKASERFLDDLIAKSEMQDDGIKFIKTLMKNGCPASAILNTLTEMSKGNSKNDT